MGASRTLYSSILQINKRNEDYRVDIHVGFTLTAHSLKSVHLMWVCSSLCIVYGYTKMVGDLMRLCY
jgi:hypothetical protein